MRGRGGERFFWARVSANLSEGVSLLFGVRL